MKWKVKASWLWVFVWLNSVLKTDSLGYSDKPMSVNATIGDNVTLNCPTFDKSNDIVHVRKDGEYFISVKEGVVDGKNGHRISLPDNVILMNVTLSDGGNYNCCVEIENNGETCQQMTLIVEPPSGEFKGPAKNQSNTGKIVGGVGGIAITIIIVIIIVRARKYQKHQQKKKQENSRRNSVEIPLKNMASSCGERPEVVVTDGNQSDTQR